MCSEFLRMYVFQRRFSKFVHKNWHGKLKFRIVHRNAKSCQSKNAILYQLVHTKTQKNMILHQLVDTKMQKLDFVP